MVGGGGALGPLLGSGGGPHPPLVNLAEGGDYADYLEVAKYTVLDHTKYR